MIKIDNIGNLKECTIWLEKLQIEEYEVAEVIRTIKNVDGDMSGKGCNIGIELFVAPRYFALLGMEYIYKDTDSIEVCVNVCKDSEVMLDNSLALPSDNVHLGISKEYAQTILNASVKVLKDFSIIPSGKLTFNVGGYSDLGSNQVIFSKVASILIKLFMELQQSEAIEGLKNIVRFELARPLTDI